MVQVNRHRCPFQGCSFYTTCERFSTDLQILIQPCILGGRTSFHHISLCATANDWPQHAASCSYTVRKLAAITIKVGALADRMNGTMETSLFSAVKQHSISFSYPSFHLLTARQCKSLPSHPNANLAYTNASLYFDTVATYTCNTGFKFKSPSSVKTCLKSGKWNSAASPPDCIGKWWKWSADKVIEEKNEKLLQLKVKGEWLPPANILRCLCGLASLQNFKHVWNEADLSFCQSVSLSFFRTGEEHKRLDTSSTLW